MNVERFKAVIKNIAAVGRKEFAIPNALVDYDSNLEPDWDTGDLNGYEASYPPRDDITIYQQDELLYPVLNDVAKEGLGYVYSKYKTGTGTSSTTTNQRNIIVVGAGIAGLAAAYELTRAGHNVQILEMQARAGGRIHTYAEKDGFAKNLYVDAGAMRLPNEPDDAPKTHYLTDHYVTDTFGLTKLPFKNYDENAYVKYYDTAAMRRTAWDGDSYNNFTEYWEGWDATFLPHIDDFSITSINGYYDETVSEVKRVLTDGLTAATSNTEAAAVWEEWVSEWSKFSINSLMRSTVEIIKETLSPAYVAKIGLDEAKLAKLLPWPEAAITAYSIFNYTEQLDHSLVLYLRDELGSWWSDNMHRIDGGTEELIKKFLQPINGINLSEKIVYNVTVQKITYSHDENNPANSSVAIDAYHTKSGQRFQFSGNAVIVTVPLHAIRQIEFVNAVDGQSFPYDFYKAVEDIWYGPSTKIMIQSRTKFWERELPGEPKITGGFSKTNLPIGQLHYPTSDVPAPGDKGILLCYTWKAEALLFGSLPEKVAVERVVRQIAQIHPEIIDEFETGAVHAWYSDPGAQGAYVLLKPHQYRHVKYLMNYPHKNLFFAGEGISHAPGWIQGALESAFRAAYQFYLRNEEASAVAAKRKK